MHSPRFEHEIEQNAQFTCPWFKWPRARSVNLLISLVTVCSSYLPKNASGYGVHWPLPWGRGAIITHRAFNRERIGKEHWYLKVVFRRMSVIQTKQGIFDISQHIQRFIWRYPGLVFIPLLQMCACFQGKRITSACLASPKQVKLKKTIIKLDYLVLQNLGL